MKKLHFPSLQFNYFVTSLENLVIKEAILNFTDKITEHMNSVILRKCFPSVCVAQMKNTSSTLLKLPELLHRKHHDLRIYSEQNRLFHNLDLTEFD